MLAVIGGALNRYFTKLGIIEDDRKSIKIRQNKSNQRRVLCFKFIKTLLVQKNLIPLRKQLSI